MQVKGVTIDWLIDIVIDWLLFWVSFWLLHQSNSVKFVSCNLLCTVHVSIYHISSWISTFCNFASEYDHFSKKTKGNSHPHGPEHLRIFLFDNL